MACIVRKKNQFLNEEKIYYSNELVKLLKLSSVYRAKV